MAEKLAFEAGLSWAHSHRSAAMKPWISVFTCLGLNFLTSVQLRLGNTRQCPSSGPHSRRGGSHATVGGRLAACPRSASLDTSEQKQPSQVLSPLLQPAMS